MHNARLLPGFDMQPSSDFAEMKKMHGRMHLDRGRNCMY